MFSWVANMFTDIGKLDSKDLENVSVTGTRTVNNDAKFFALLLAGVLLFNLLKKK